VESAVEGNQAGSLGASSALAVVFAFVREVHNAS